MPHKCAICGWEVDAGSTIVLDGCPFCNGKKFIYIHGESSPYDQPEESFTVSIIDEVRERPQPQSSAIDSRLDKAIQFTNGFSESDLGERLHSTLAQLDTKIKKAARYPKSLSIRDVTEEEKSRISAIDSRMKKVALVAKLFSAWEVREGQQSRISGMDARIDRALQVTLELNVWEVRRIMSQYTARSPKSFIKTIRVGLLRKQYYSLRQNLLRQILKRI